MNDESVIGTSKQYGIGKFIVIEPQLISNTRFLSRP